MHLIESQHVSPADLGAWDGVLSFPWFVKPLWGLMSDAFPWCGYHRRPYISVGFLLVGLMWLAMTSAYETLTFSQTMGCMFLQSLCLCISDVAADGLMVAMVKVEKKAGQLQSYVWSVRLLGSILGTTLGTTCKTLLGTRGVYAAAAAVPLVGGVGIWWCDERPATRDGSLYSAHLEETRRGLRYIYDESKYLIAFCFLFTATPSYDDSLFIFLQTQLAYTMKTLASLELVAKIAALVGTGLFYWCSRRYRMRTLMVAACVVQVLVRCGLIFIVQHPAWSGQHLEALFLLYAENIVLAILGQFAVLPLLLVGAHICPEGFESACYATFLSVENMGGATSMWLGAGLVDLLGIHEGRWDNLGLLIFLCSVSVLAPLVMLYTLPISFDVFRTSEECAKLVESTDDDDDDYT